ncbi:MAG: hypothetical protein Q9218_004445 [Villophora microphyllina]
MSTTSGRRVTRSVSRQNSREPSETSSVAGNDFPNLRSRAGSPTKRRNDAITKDNKSYGAKSAPASAQKNRPGRVNTGGIAQAVELAQVRTYRPRLHNQGQLGSLEEGNDEEEEVLAGPLDGIGQRVNDDEWNQEHNGNQPMEDSSALQRQFTLSDSDHSTERSSVFSHLLPKHYVAIAAFLFLLTILFADIYRGPLLGSRFDFFKSRHANTYIKPFTIGALEHRIKVLERQSDDFEKIEHRFGILEWQQQQRDDNDGQLLNFFSRVNLPLVNPYLTSPTATYPNWRPPPRWLPVLNTDRPVPENPGWWDRLWLVDSNVVPHSKPADVFGPWWDKDFGPSWCAAAGDSKLQLATLLDPMTPTALVVEHNPSTNAVMPRIVTAPKEIELWMAVQDDTVRESIGRAVVALYGPFDSDAATGTNRALPLEYVPIGRWIYDFPSGKSMQTFHIGVDLQGVSTGNLVVRVNSNWANARNSCLYRLRLFGKSHVAGVEIDTSS